jgi:hypothetical protein
MRDWYSVVRNGVSVNASLTYGAYTSRNKGILEYQGEPYIEHLYDCSNKSSKYCRILREKGYDANIIVTKVGEGQHAIVFIRFGNGDLLYCDPTQGKWSTEIDAFGIPKHIIPFEERLDEKWAHEFVEIF